MKHLYLLLFLLGINTHLHATDTYYIYVRTYNWTAPWVSGKGPGGFAVMLNGSVIGTAGHDGKAWEWQRVGQKKLKAGSHRLALRDLQGFDGRCDAIFLTSRKDFIPPKDANTTWRASLNPIHWRRHCRHVLRRFSRPSGIKSSFGQ